MNQPHNQDYNRRLEELEAELESERSSATGQTPIGQRFQRYINREHTQAAIEKTRQWFNRLPTSGKVTVAVVAVLVGFSVLASILQLVASLVALAILGVILYLVYKFFISSESSQ
jgi:hypothetical protein